MKRLLTVFAMGVTAIAVASPGWAQVPRLRLSWDQCDPQVRNHDFSATAHNLVVTATNMTAANANIGSELTLTIGPNVPEAWRFDDAGCQTGAGLAFSHAAINKAICPTMIGGSSLDITQYSYDLISQNATLRLTVTHDGFTPGSASTFYTIWKVTFHHELSASGTDSDPNTCDNGGQMLCISGNGSLLETGGGKPDFTFASPNDQFVWWSNASLIGSCAVPTKAQTWGRVKQQYR